MRKTGILSIFIGFLVVMLHTPAAGAEDDEISKRLRVEVEGARKTIKSVITRAAQLRHKYVPEEGLDAEQIRQRLMNTHLFSDVKVELEEFEDEVVAHITVKERWTLVPVPVFFSNEEETGGGGFLFEPNLLGRQKVLLAGAIFTTRGSRFQANYLDQNFLDTRWVLFTRAVYSETVFQRFSGDDEVFAYKQAFTNFALSIGYRLTDKLIPSIGAMYRKQETEREDGFPEPPPNLDGHSFIFNMRYDGTEYERYYDRGIKAMLTIDQAARTLGADRMFAHLVATGGYTVPFREDLLFHLNGEVGAGWGKHDVLTFYRLGGKVGSRGLPSRGVWVPEYGAWSVAIEEPLCRHRFGTLTTTQFGDFLLTGEDRPVRSYPGIGFGLRIYLKEIALPALGVDGAFSTWTKDFRLSAFIGKSF